MKTRVLSILLAGMMAGGMIAQEVNTQYFLDMSPMRHQINPAFEPTTDGYMLLIGAGNLDLAAGNNLFTMADVIWKDPSTGKTMLITNEGADRTAFLNRLKKNPMVLNTNVSTNLLNFGWRGRKWDKNYFHFGLNARVEARASLPEDLFRFALENTPIDNYDLGRLNIKAQGLIELSLGFQRHESDFLQWGVKGKLLVGAAYANFTTSQLGIHTNTDNVGLNGEGRLQFASVGAQMPEQIKNDNLAEAFEHMYSLSEIEVKDWIKPAGMGAAVDAGVNLNPLPMLGINASITDLGFVRWNQGMVADVITKAQWQGVDIVYSDYVDADGKWDSEKFNQMMGEIGQQLQDSLLLTSGGKKAFTNMLSPKLNIGIDGKFVNNKIGVSLYSKTQLYNKRLFEELTIGFTARPTNWFNAAITYSLLNGKWSNLGAGLGLRLGPFQLTAALDYIPLVYAHSSDIKMGIPYKTPGVNANIGLAVVWGWKKKAPKMEVTRTENISGAAYGVDKKHTR